MHFIIKTLLIDKVTIDKMNTQIWLVIKGDYRQDEYSNLIGY